MGVWNESLHKRDEIGRFARMDGSGEKKSEEKKEPQAERKGPGVTLGTKEEAERTEGKLTPEQKAEQSKRDKQATDPKHSPVYDKKTYLKERIPGTFAKVHKGNEMTFEQADGNNPNPCFGKGLIGYEYNCQSCVVVFEARLRGYNVRALPLNRNKEMDRIADNPLLAWIDEGLHHPKRTENKSKTTIHFLEENIKSEGRYILSFGVLDDRHIVCVDKVDGALRLYDPQCGKVSIGERKITQYLKEVGAKEKTEWVARVDNFEIDPGVADFIMIGAD